MRDKIEAALTTWFRGQGGWMRDADMVKAIAGIDETIQAAYREEADRLGIRIVPRVLAPYAQITTARRVLDIDDVIRRPYGKPCPLTTAIVNQHHELAGVLKMCKAKAVPAAEPPQVFLGREAYQVSVLLWNHVGQLDPATA